ncbi:MAG: excisionase family DNA-binding protein [Oscillospiraceae bacterium]|nr:excisionase family DNA-binding protein [Oscillospiraceae bacterium]
MAKEVPIWEKSNLTLEEAAAYSGIGMGKLRELTNEKNCNFVLWVGSKRLIKKRLFDRYIEQVDSI